MAPGSIGMDQILVIMTKVIEIKSWLSTVKAYSVLDSDNLRAVNIELTSFETQLKEFAAKESNGLLDRRLEPLLTNNLFTSCFTVVTDLYATIMSYSGFTKERVSWAQNFRSKIVEPVKIQQASLLRSTGDLYTFDRILKFLLDLNTVLTDPSSSWNPAIACFSSLRAQATDEKSFQTSLSVKMTNTSATCNRHKILYSFLNTAATFLPKDPTGLSRTFPPLIPSQSTLTSSDQASIRASRTSSSLNEDMFSPNSPGAQNVVSTPPANKIIDIDQSNGAPDTEEGPDQATSPIRDSVRPRGTTGSPQVDLGSQIQSLLQQQFFEDQKEKKMLEERIKVLEEQSKSADSRVDEEKSKTQALAIRFDELNAKYQKVKQYYFVIADELDKAKLAMNNLQSRCQQQTEKINDMAQEHNLLTEHNQKLLDQLQTIKDICAQTPTLRPKIDVPSDAPSATVSDASTIPA